MFTFTYEQIGQKLIEQDSFDPVPNDTYATAAECAEYYLSEMAEKVEAEIRSYGFNFDQKAMTVTFDDADVLDKIDQLTNKITEAYEGDDADNVWASYGLGGDDDVDYNGGYIDGVTEAIRELMKGSDNG